VLRRSPLTRTDTALTGTTRRSPVLLATLAAVPVALAVGLFAFWLLGGFDRDHLADDGRVVTAAPPDLPGADASCAKLLNALPRELAGATPRPVTEAPHRVVAWGRPPIVLTCGVNRPKALTPTAQVLGIEGVEWVTGTERDFDVWTTTSLALNVEVRVPTRYREKASTAIINPLAAPLKASIPAGNP
jgi:hypothetical protein